MHRCQRASVKGAVLITMHTVMRVVEIRFAKCAATFVTAELG